MRVVKEPVVTLDRTGSIMAVWKVVMPNGKTYRVITYPKLPNQKVSLMSISNYDTGRQLGHYSSLKLRAALRKVIHLVGPRYEL